MAERREYIRYDIEGHIDLKTEDGAISSFKVDVIDISFLGVSVYSKEKIDILDKIVYFELISGLLEQPLIGKGRVKYIHEEIRNKAPVFRMGLEFIDMDKSALLHFLNITQEMLALKIRRAGHARNGPDIPDSFGTY
ncbi:MAG: PilZ domain-containing protein [Candidatus Omnitrophica bacterium]|nr:PilZ domain-containing protein [Candidatus Omnitrophota bacterium]